MDRAYPHGTYVSEPVAQYAISLRRRIPAARLYQVSSVLRAFSVLLQIHKQTLTPDHIKALPFSDDVNSMVRAVVHFHATAVFSPATPHMNTPCSP